MHTREAPDFWGVTQNYELHVSFNVDCMWICIMFWFSYYSIDNNIDYVSCVNMLY